MITGLRGIVNSHVKNYHSTSTECTFDILQLFGFGNSGNPPTTRVRKNSSNFLRWLPMIALPSDQTIANWKKPCSQNNICTHEQYTNEPQITL